MAQVKNLPAYAWDTGSIPDPGRPHMPQSNKACVPKLLNLCSRAQERQLLRPHALGPALHGKRRYCNEKPEHHTSIVQKLGVKRGKGDEWVGYTLRTFPRSCQLILQLTSPCPELSYLLYLPPGQEIQPLFQISNKKQEDLLLKKRKRMGNRVIIYSPFHTNHPVA